MEPAQDNETLAKKFLRLNQGQRFYPPVPNITVFSSGAAGFPARFGGYYDDDLSAAWLIVQKESQGVAYGSETKFMNICAELLQKYWRDPSVLDTRIRQFHELQNTIADIYDRVTHDYVSSADFHTLIEDVRMVTEASRKLSMVTHFSVMLHKGLCLGLMQKCGMRMSTQGFDAIWERGGEPSFLSFEQARSAVAWGLLGHDKRDWQHIAETCQYFSANYNKILDLRESEQDLREKYGSVSSQEAQESLEKLEVEDREKQARHKQWLATLDDEERKVASYLQGAMLIRDRRKDSIGKALTIAFRVAQKMFAHVGLDENFIYFYSYEEMIKGIDYLQENKDAIARRPQGFVFLMHYDGSMELEYGTYQETRSILEQAYLAQERPAKAKSGHVRGQTASPGFARGVARIVLDPRDPKGFQEVDILVTGMTRPEFVPLMKKAAAIVTDEGGITCHAAIISRELKKPCVIGTRMATRTFKDGDVVKVDADKGTVSIAEK